MVRPEDRFEPVFEDMRARQADAVSVQGSLLRRKTVDLALDIGSHQSAISGCCPKWEG
jgi:hypothetical protein